MQIKGQKDVSLKKLEEISSMKTAEFFASCFAFGIFVGGSESDLEKKLDDYHDLGMAFGMFYQFNDDLHDLSNDNRSDFRDQLIKKKNYWYENFLEKMKVIPKGKPKDAILEIAQLIKDS